MLSLNSPSHKKGAKTFQYDDSLEGLRNKLRHVILKAFPKIHIEIEPSKEKEGTDNTLLVLLYNSPGI